MTERGGSPAPGGDLDSLTTPMLPALRHVAQLRAAMPTLRAERDAAARRFDAIADSTIWRVSAPLRRLMDGVRRFRARTHADTAADRALGQAKAEWRARCARDLDAFLASVERLSLPAAEQPRVSIVIVVFDQAELTFDCLASIARDAPREADVIILDNGSTDRTEALLERLDGARVIRAGRNLHFLRGVNRASEEARGRYLLLLNNDTRVEPGAIAAAAARLDAEPDLGAVGGPILLPDGRLQEAGSIIWRDGTTVGHGRGEDPADVAFAFRRDVDYCSGAFLMVRRDLFEGLGHLDEAYAPAYYEEADLCMRIRAAGFRVGYEPAARIVHVEFGSALSDGDAPRLSARNRAVFVARHAAVLAAQHHPPTTPQLVARMRGGAAGRLLVLDARDWGAAPPDQAAPTLCGMLAAQGFAVTFCTPRDRPGAAPPPGVECAVLPQADALLRRRPGHYDAVLLIEADGDGLPATAQAALEAALDGTFLLRLPRFGPGA